MTSKRARQAVLFPFSEKRAHDLDVDVDVTTLKECEECGTSDDRITHNIRSPHRYGRMFSPAP